MFSIFEKMMSYINLKYLRNDLFSISENMAPENMMSVLTSNVSETDGPWRPQKRPLVQEPLYSSIPFKDTPWTMCHSDL